jgi:hypothetical protein
LLSNFTLEYAFKKVQEKQKELELNKTHLFLVNAGNVNRSGENINTIKKSKEAQLEASREVSLEVNAEKTKYMVISTKMQVKITIY